MIDFIFEDNSIRVEELPLWLDSSSYRSDGRLVRRPLNFTSHAHADHLGRHRRIICSHPTLELMKARQKVEEVVALDFGQSYRFADAEITLYPAGHILGSALILVEKDSRRICYTGDFRLGKGLTTEECEPVECDVLLTECTFGHPRYSFPSRDELLARLEHFVEECFDNSEVPVLLGYSLGKAQEAIKALGICGYGVVTHETIMDICRIYEKFGVSFPNVARFGEGPIGRRAVVFPPQISAREQLRSLGKIRTAILTGWAQDGRGAGLFGADEAIPFSDHSDFEGLVRFAEESGAGKILTHHGDAVRFAELLKGKGLNAEPLIPPDQGRLF